MASSRCFRLETLERGIGIRYPNVGTNPPFPWRSVAQGQRDAEDLRFQGINEVPKGRGDFYVYTGLCLLEKHPKNSSICKKSSEFEVFWIFFWWVQIF